jgi:hypothetical protein
MTEHGSDDRNDELFSIATKQKIAIGAGAGR